MEKWDQGNGSKQADHLPGNQLEKGIGFMGGRDVFSNDRKTKVDFVLRRESGSKFQTVGAA